MKHLFTTAALLFSMTAFAQVGINNTSPKATLDITAKTSGTKPEGLIIPQLSGDQIRTATAAGVYGSNQKGLIIYATSADSSPISTTANITAAGYYYFDGTNWQKISTGNTVSTSLASGNIYVGSASNVATAVSPTGDVTISNTGATTIAANAVTTSKIANNAVTVAKLPAGATATTFLRGDGTWVTPTDTNTTYTAGTGLTLTGTSFSANDATTGTKGIVQLAGDLTGTAASPTVAKIQNKAVSSTAPTNGQVLKYNTTTSAWEPSADTDTNTTYTAGSGLTLTGTSFSANDATTGTKGIVQLSGDLTGTAASPTVAKIQNKAVSSTAPTNGQVLKYNTTTSAWEPAVDIDTNTTYTGSATINLNGTSFERTALSGDVTASANSNTTTIAANAVTSAKIADGAVTASKLNQMSATSGQVLGWNGTTWAPTTSDTTNDAWINDTTNSLVKLGTKADGTARSAGTDFVAKDNGQVGIGTNNPDASAALDIASTNKGLLIPRVSLTGITDQTTIASPAMGLIAYNTSTNINGPGLVFNRGTSTSPKWSSVQVYSNDAGAISGKLVYQSYPDGTKTMSVGNLEFRAIYSGDTYYFQIRRLTAPSGTSTYYCDRIAWFSTNVSTTTTSTLSFNSSNYNSWQTYTSGNISGLSGVSVGFLTYISSANDSLYYRVNNHSKFDSNSFTAFIVEAF
ncbi:hypothetical protein [Flavobacterium sp. B17]|uniref:beta strand repeat-containing protein n=1 Tax=Flavobacterium sp. B17 TaxID=95618 RepID=UPI000348EA2F|nr:hypothetical protein [Flavobacterium sp. B17]